MLLRQVQQPERRLVDLLQGVLDVEVKADGACIVDDM